MALLTALVDILNPDGSSAVPLRADGTRPIVKVLLGPGLVASGTLSGDTAIVTIAATSQAAQGYVSTMLPEGTTNAVEGLWYNDTGSARLVAVTLLPFDTVGHDAGNFWLLGLSLSTAPNTPIASVSGATVDFTGGTPIALSAVNVPAGVTLLASKVKTGAPSSIAVFAQGR